MNKKIKTLSLLIAFIVGILAIVKFYNSRKENRLTCQNYNAKILSLNKLIISEQKLNVDFIKSSIELLESYNRDLSLCNMEDVNFNLNELYESVYDRIGYLLKMDTTNLSNNNSLEICALCDLLITVCSANDSTGYYDKCSDDHKNIIFNIKTLKCQDL